MKKVTSISMQIIRWGKLKLKDTKSVVVSASVKQARLLNNTGHLHTGREGGREV